MLKINEVLGLLPDHCCNLLLANFISIIYCVDLENAFGAQVFSFLAI